MYIIETKAYTIECEYQSAETRIKSLMPEYYPRETMGLKIDIAPTGAWRLFFRRLHIEPPYFVGDKIRLIFTFTKINEKDFKQLGGYVIFLAYYPQNEGFIPPHRMKDIPALENNVVKMTFDSNTELGKDGSVTIYIVDKASIDKSGRFESERFERIPVFTTGVKHKDLILSDIFLVLIGAVFGAVFGYLFSFLH